MSSCCHPHLLLIATLLCLADAESPIAPGLVVNLNSPSLELLSDFASGTLATFLRDNRSVSLDGTEGGVKYRLRNLRSIRYSDEFQTKFEFVPREGIELTIQNLSFSLLADYRLQWWVLYNEGKLRIDIHGLSLRTTLTGSVKDGKLSPKAGNCIANPGAVALRFTDGPLNGLLNWFQDDFSLLLKTNLRSQLCDFIEKYFMPEVEKRFAAVPDSLLLFDNLYMNYGLIAKPHIGIRRITTWHSGEIYAKQRNGQDDHSYVTSLNENLFGTNGWTKGRKYFPTPPRDDRMVSVYVSTFVLDGILFHLHRYGKLSFEFSKESLPVQFAEYLKTTCEAICAGLLYPSLAELHPNSSVSVKLTLNEPPTSRIVDGFIHAQAVLKMHGFVGEHTEIFNGLANLSVHLRNFSLEDGQINGFADVKHLEVTDVQSQYDDITADSFSFFIDSVSDSLVQPQLQSFLQEGIRLPETGPFRIIDGRIELLDDVVALSANFQPTRFHNF